MSLLTVVQDVCTVVGVAVPTSVIAAIGTNRTMQEMLNCANVMAQRTAYDAGREWTDLQKVAMFTGDGTTTTWPLPSDYKRMLLNTNLRRSDAPQQEMRFISDYDEWLMRRVGVETSSWGEWIKVGGQILIWPALSAHTSPVWGTSRVYRVGEIILDSVTENVWLVAVEHTSAASGTFADDRTANPTFWTLHPTQTIDAITVMFPYLERNCIALASGGYGDRFLSDDDTFRLDERLLHLGMIWQWKAWKGSPYAEDMGTWSDAIAMEMGHDKPSPIIIGGRSMRDSWFGYAQY